jgi:hypothetical protein
MAWCEVCGRWAGFFKRVHDQCATVNPEIVTPAAPVIQRPVELTAGFAFGPAMPTNAVIWGVRSVMEPFVPDTRSVLIEALNWAKVDDQDHAIATTIASQLATANATGAAQAGFLEWCRDESSGVDQLSYAWHHLLWWAGFAMEHAQQGLDQTWQNDKNSIFPYFELCTYGCPCPSHQALDGFVARNISPVWLSAWPPNDWLCNCIVLSMLEDGALERRRSPTRKRQRLSTKFLDKSRNWHQRSPEAAIETLTLQYAPRARRRRK